MGATVEYIGNTRLGEKGQLTIPKQYRDDLGLETGAPIAVLRIGESLMLIPEQKRFRLLCESIGSVLSALQVAEADLLESLPEARKRVYARRYPALAKRRSRNG